MHRHLKSAGRTQTPPAYGGSRVAAYPWVPPAAYSTRKVAAEEAAAEIPSPPRLVWDAAARTEHGFNAPSMSMDGALAGGEEGDSGPLTALGTALKVRQPATAPPRRPTALTALAGV